MYSDHFQPSAPLSNPFPHLNPVSSFLINHSVKFVLPYTQVDPSTEVFSTCQGPGVTKSYSHLVYLCSTYAFLMQFLLLLYFSLLFFLPLSSGALCSISITFHSCVYLFFRSIYNAHIL